MSREGFYYLKIDLPEDENQYLQSAVETVKNEIGFGKMKKKFHLTIDEESYCSNKGIRIDLNRWLGLQQSFDLTLDKVDYFENRKDGLVYLTTKDKDQLSKIKNLHYSIHEIIKSNDLKRQNNFRYEPHVTLLDGIPLEKISDVKGKLRQVIERPIRLDISEIAVINLEETGKDFKCRFGMEPIFSFPTFLGLEA